MSKVAIFALVLCVLTIAENHVSAEGGSLCEPGSSFKRSCNTCVCNDDGSNAACTLKGCFEDASGPVLQCVPLEKFKRYCNDCECNEDGSKFTCTEKVCDTEVGVVSSRPVQKCTPHVSFQEECNTCTCNAEGTFNICTTKACEKIEGNKDETTAEGVITQKPEQKCKPNDSYKEDCNTCTCNAEGTLAMCTAIDCTHSDVPSKVEEKDHKEDKDHKEEKDHKDHTDHKVEAAPPTVFRCKPMDVFKMDCNTCVCNIEGTAASCSEITCSHYRNEAIIPTPVEKKDSPASEVLQDEPKKPIEVIKKEDEPIVKKEEEVSVTVKPAFQCKALESYKMDACNTCVCNEYGTNAACTQIDCQDTPVADVPKVTIEVEVEKSSTVVSHEHHHESDGSTTSASIETVSTPATINQGFLCKPGTQFMNDCNTCTCNEKGDEAVCTLLVCPSHSHN